MKQNWLTMKCPNCGKRAFDISCLPAQQEACVSLKCPNCHQVVMIPCDQAHTMNRGKVVLSRSAVSGHLTTKYHTSKGSDAVTRLRSGRE